MTHRFVVLDCRQTLKHLIHFLVLFPREINSHRNCCRPLTLLNSANSWNQVKLDCGSTTTANDSASIHFTWFLAPLIPLFSCLSFCHSHLVAQPPTNSKLWQNSSSFRGIISRQKLLSSACKPERHRFSSQLCAIIVWWMKMLCLLIPMVQRRKDMRITLPGV